jgi:hypothetical protein
LFQISKDVVHSSNVPETILIAKINNYYHNSESNE